MAGVAKSAAKGEKRPAVESELASHVAGPSEEVEAYDRSMSPPLLDIRKLPYEERQIDIVAELEDLRALARCLFVKAPDAADLYIIDGTTSLSRRFEVRA